MHPANNLNSSPLLALIRHTNLDCLQLLFAAGYRTTEAERLKVQLSNLELGDNNGFARRIYHNGGRGRGRGRGHGLGRRGRYGHSRQPSAKSKSNPILKELLETEFSNVWSLDRLCKTAIRNVLPTPLSAKVMYLPLPLKIRNSLLLENMLDV